MGNRTKTQSQHGMIAKICIFSGLLVIGGNRFFMITLLSEIKSRRVPPAASIAVKAAIGGIHMPYEYRN
jgi:hypothetical protein